MGLSVVDEGYQELKLVDRYLGVAALLERSLPRTHPVMSKVNQLAEELQEKLSEPEPHKEEAPEDWRLALCELVDLIEDWKRGIRDWDEVDEYMKNCLVGISG